jgi:hypothetical protein
MQFAEDGEEKSGAMALAETEPTKADHRAGGAAMLLSILFCSLC